jgi:hypothetical protein
MYLISLQGILLVGIISLLALVIARYSISLVFNTMSYFLIRAAQHTVRK